MNPESTNLDIDNKEDKKVISNLQDHIDDPIKKCVVGMALLGFNPQMSCCGFSYKGEKVPKKHLKKAYMFLNFSDVIDNNLGNKLLEISKMSRWKFNVLAADYIDFYAQTWQKDHPWDDDQCPHFYENFLLGINALEGTLIHLKEHFKKTTIIRDGNHLYKTKMKYWQYEPTEDWVVTPEIFDSL